MRVGVGGDVWWCGVENGLQGGGCVVDVGVSEAPGKPGGNGRADVVLVFVS